MSEGIQSVLQAANAEIGTTPTIDSMMAESINIPNPEELATAIREEIRSQSNSPGVRRRGRPKGSKNLKTPPSDDFEQRTRAYMAKVGEAQAENPRIILLRKKISKMFHYFPHKLNRYFNGEPNVTIMSLQELLDTEKLCLSIIDEADESLYVKQAFKWLATVIEKSGPSIQQRFLRWAPGSDILQFQDGLSDAVDELIEVPGEEGLADDVHRVSLDFIGWVPANPYVNSALKILKLMSAMKQASVYADAAPDKPRSTNPMDNI